MNNGTGKGGRVFNDRALAAKVRTLTLEQIRDVLEDNDKKNKQFKQAVILKLAGTILPRLNVVSGDDENPLQAHVTVEFVDKSSVSTTA